MLSSQSEIVSMIDQPIKMSMIDRKDLRFDVRADDPDASCSPGSIQMRTHPSQNNVNFSELGKKMLEAARNGDTAEVRELTNAGAPFATDWLGASPLHYACQFGHIETATFLLRGGIPKDARNKVDRTPLHMAAQEGQAKSCKLLAEYGVDIDARDMLKMTPLHWAVQRGNRECVEMLLNCGADVTIPNKFEKTALDIAYSMGHMDIVQMLQNFKVAPVKPKVNIVVPTTTTTNNGRQANRNAGRNRLKIINLTQNSMKIKKEMDEDDEAEMAIKSMRNSEGKNSRKDNFLPNILTNGQSLGLTETGRAIFNTYCTKDGNTASPSSTSANNSYGNKKTTTPVNLNNSKIANMFLVNKPFSIDQKTVNSAAAKNIHITKYQGTGSDKVQVLNSKTIVINSIAQKDEEIRKLKEQLAKMKHDLDEYKNLIISKDLELNKLKSTCNCDRRNSNSNNNICYNNNIELVDENNVLNCVKSMDEANVNDLYHHVEVEVQVDSADHEVEMLD